MNVELAQGGGYLVTDDNRMSFWVYKCNNVVCSCGGVNSCEHISAVKTYLDNGGERAKNVREKDIAQCIVCGRAVHTKTLYCPSCQGALTEKMRGLCGAWNEHRQSTQVEYLTENGPVSVTMKEAGQYWDFT